MRLEKLIIIPYPRKIEFRQGSSFLNKECCISIPSKDKQAMLSVAKRVQQIIRASTSMELPVVLDIKGPERLNIIFENDMDLCKESYKLDIGEEGIYISYGECAGAFHAVSTLKQIIQQCGKVLPNLTINDNPDFDARGIMLEIDGRVPRMDTLFKIVNLMADLKLNQLQLYMSSGLFPNSFPFAYPSYPEVWKGQTPMTGEEFIILDKYCRERFIELVPNQNSFGHLTAWLSKKEFNDLSECPDGFDVSYIKSSKPWSLNPLDPRSIRFIESLYDDLLPYFTSGLINIGCDETHDLGTGKSREACGKTSRERVYLDFLMKLYELAKSRGRKIMFWGDIILNSPELVSQLPEDIIALEWGYNADQPSLEDCEKFMCAGIPYYVCPGTHSWNSIAGQTDIMKSNLFNAAVLGKKYGAIGYLNTDWGDFHIGQYLPVSYPGFCYGAALSWGVEQNKDIDIAAYLDRFVFLDRNNKMGQFVMNLGKYYLKEIKTKYDGTGIYRTLAIEQLDNKNTMLSFLNLPDMGKKDFEEVKKYVTALCRELDYADMQCEDAELIDAEFRNIARLILHGADLGLFKLGGFGKEDMKRQLKNLVDDISLIIKEYKDLWLKRYRSGELEVGIKELEDLRGQYAAAYCKLTSEHDN